VCLKADDAVGLDKKCSTNCALLRRFLRVGKAEFVATRYKNDVANTSFPAKKSD
jgi:ketopantoate hydroxymethyltransferase